MDTEHGWLIERGEGGFPEYWNGNHWSKDHMDAQRFSRQIDAYKQIHMLAGLKIIDRENVRTVSHSWEISSPSAPASGAWLDLVIELEKAQIGQPATMRDLLRRTVRALAAARLAAPPSAPASGAEQMRLALEAIDAVTCGGPQMSTPYAIIKRCNEIARAALTEDRK